MSPWFPVAARLRHILAAGPLVLWAVLCPAPVTGQPASLFTSVPAARPPLPAAERTVRHRVVTLDLEQVQHARAVVAAASPSGQTTETGSSTKDADPVPAPGTTLSFNLFDDVVVTGVVERTAPTFSGGYAVSGYLVDDPVGTLTLVVNGASVAGTVRTLGETYHIRSLGDGLYAISEVEESPLTCGVEGPHSETDHQH